MKKIITLSLAASIVLAMPALLLSMDTGDIFDFEEPRAVSTKTPTPFEEGDATALVTALSESPKAKRRAQITENFDDMADQSRDTNAAQAAITLLRNVRSGHTSPKYLSRSGSGHHSPLQGADSSSEKNGTMKHRFYSDETRLTPVPTPPNSQKRLKQILSDIQTQQEQPDTTITQPSVLPNALPNPESLTLKPSDRVTLKIPEQPQPDVAKSLAPTSVQKSSLWVELTKAGISITALVVFLYYMDKLPESITQLFDTCLSKLNNLVSLDTSATDK